MNPILLIASFLIAAGVFRFQPPAVEQLVPEVINTLPHDPTAFTQGLVLHEDLFYESTGKFGASSLRQVDPATGEVLVQVNLPPYIFGEGLALVNDRLIQLTWTNGAAIVYDFEAFRDNALDDASIYQYEGQGWGLCYDGEHLYMSDGSSTLFQRDPNTFEVVGQVEVTLDGDPVSRLNELECVEASVYANVYQTDQIVRIDKSSGEVTASIDASGLLSAEDRAAVGGGLVGTTLNNLLFDASTGKFVNYRETYGGDNVLNGIAYNPTTDTFFITGKMWPRIYEVRFVEAAAE